MAALVSPGVSVTVTDESFYVPASAPTVPLFIIATADDKRQDPTDPTSARAEGTQEFGVVRTITSLRQSVETYGIPRFLQTGGEPHHGDARNEYGLAALNAFLGQGSTAYVIRANVNLNDDFVEIQASWDYKMQNAQTILENLVNSWIYEYNLLNPITPKSTIPGNDLYDLMEVATQFIWESYSFSLLNLQNDFFADQSAAPFDVFDSGFNNPPSIYQYFGVANFIATWNAGSVIPNEFTATEAGGALVTLADDFKWTQPFLFKTALGADDSARRVAIVQALRTIINLNQDIRAEGVEYNLVLCPGYPEVTSDLQNLVVNFLKEEVLVIGDTPMNDNPQELQAWASSVNRIIDSRGNVAYYYPHILTSNLDGAMILVPSSAWALRTMTFSDNVSYQWFAPAGIRRGGMTGVIDIGYVVGTLGTPTEFIQLHPNQGQRDVLYAYTASGSINPLAFFPGRGFLVWGQKTSTGTTATALDRVNVSRLVKYVARSLRKATLPFVFEPNDALTRDNLKAMVDGFLGDLIVKRGLYDYATICDESNNTPDRIERNEMYIDIAIKPVKAAEFIYVPIRIVATGAVI